MWSIPVTEYRQLLVAATLILSPVMAAAQQASNASAYSHATFVDGKKSMASLVKFPDYNADIEISVVCRGHASAKGRLQNVLCSAPNDPDSKFAKAVSKRVYSSRLNPAIVNGEPQEVDIQFMVTFRRSDADESIAVYLNNGNNTERLGPDYISAQRYSPHVWPNRCSDRRDNEVVIEAATIDASGRPRDVNAMSSRERLFEACRGALMSQLESGRWIPAKHGDQFVESVWVNPIMLNMREIEF